ncbi:hypothetical protein PYCCODRAFT_459146 [Trametes coccinea BRFM310]|uniref:Uncharacterized protein n=1 Tax=Trametes coccinea (strain BRFM310) TaxID=1353009 RepID=A0A1Y2ILD0_TRAC3|nr:hypothetical protein PYCCODRAFT_459146 [Trametes coccinea BRFM310]
MVSHLAICPSQQVKTILQMCVRTPRGTCADAIGTVTVELTISSSLHLSSNHSPHCSHKHPTCADRHSKPPATRMPPARPIPRPMLPSITGGAHAPRRPPQPPPPKRGATPRTRALCTPQYLRPLPRRRRNARRGAGTFAAIAASCAIRFLIAL